MTLLISNTEGVTDVLMDNAVDGPHCRFAILWMKSMIDDVIGSNKDRKHGRWLSLWIGKMVK